MLFLTIQTKSLNLLSEMPPQILLLESGYINIRVYFFFLWWELLYASEVQCGVMPLFFQVISSLD